MRLIPKSEINSVLFLLADRERGRIDETIGLAKWDRKLLGRLETEQRAIYDQVR